MACSDVTDKTYPRVAWVICPETGDPWYLEGNQTNYERAGKFAAQRGCSFSNDRMILTSAPTVGHWAG